MRRTFILGLALSGALFGLNQTGQAQSLGANALFSDPFLAYYGFFIPNQLAQAARPRPEDTVRQFSAARQYTALTERSSLYEPIGALGIDDDPLRAFGSASGNSRLPRTSPTGLVNNNLSGTGPSGYYNRVNNYYPSLRLGRGGNGGLNPISSSVGRSSNMGRHAGMRAPSRPGLGLPPGVSMGAGFR